MTSRQTTSISPPGQQPLQPAAILKQQMQQPSPRLGLMPPPDSTASVVNGAASSPAVYAAQAPGGPMPLSLALLAQQQQSPIYIYPQGLQSFPCYFPGTPLPGMPHPGAAPAAPFSPAAALMAAMGVSPSQNSQSLPSSPFISPPNIGASLNSVFRFNQPQQPPPPSSVSLSAPQQQMTPANTSKTPSGEIGVISPRSLQPTNGMAVATNATAATPVIVSSSFNKGSTHPPNIASACSPKHQVNSISSPPGVNKPSLNFEARSPSPLSSISSNQKTRKRPPNLTIPNSNFDVEPVNNVASSTGDRSSWHPVVVGGGVLPKAPKTAPTLPSTNAWSGKLTPRGFPMATASSAGPRGRGRPPLHHKPAVNSTDLNGFPGSHPSSSSSAYNSPNIFQTGNLNSASHSTTGSDLSANHGQQDVVVNSPSHLLYPDHFKRGSLIRLADGSFKCVEDMSTSDFTRSAQLSGELQLDSSQVLHIEPNPMRGAAMLHLAVGDHSPINVIKINVEAPLEHPFFVYNVGWSSCDPERTRARYGLAVSKLQIGDKCISLTKKSSNATGALSSSSLTTTVLPPPPPPPPLAAPVKRATGSNVPPAQVTPPMPQRTQQTAVENGAIVVTGETTSAEVVSQPMEDAKTETESKEDMESIATASLLLSLQQSKNSIVSQSIPNKSTKVEIDPKNQRHSPSSPATPSSGLIIVDTPDSSVKEETRVNTDQSISPPRMDDQSSVASEPLMAKGLLQHKVVQRSKDFHPKQAGKPRLILFPGYHLAKKTAKLGSPTYSGLQRRRHRSTSALAVAELSPKSKVFLRNKELVFPQLHTASKSPEESAGKLSTEVISGNDNSQNISEHSANT